MDTGQGGKENVLLNTGKKGVVKFGFKKSDTHELHGQNHEGWKRGKKKDLDELILGRDYVKPNTMREPDVVGYFVKTENPHYCFWLNILGKWHYICVPI